MRNIFLGLLLIHFCVNSVAQDVNTSKYSLKLSGGRVLFGTGDVPGFAIGVEASKNILKKQSPGLIKLLVGAEVSFENGAKNPIVKDVSQQEFLRITFYHVSNTVLNPKLTYYPFGKILSGFNIAVGPSIGFSYQSTEWQSSRIQLSDGLYYRSTFLDYKNGWIVGYRISTGYELNLNRKVLTGFRLDFTNYSNGDINTLAAVKFGIRW